MVMIVIGGAILQFGLPIFGGVVLGLGIATVLFGPMATVL